MKILVRITVVEGKFTHFFPHFTPSSFLSILPYTFLFFIYSSSSHSTDPWPISNRMRNFKLLCKDKLKKLLQPSTMTRMMSFHIGLLEIQSYSTDDTHSTTFFFPKPSTRHSNIPKAVTFILLHPSMSHSSRRR